MLFFFTKGDSIYFKVLRFSISKVTLKDVYLVLKRTNLQDLNKFWNPVQQDIKAGFPINSNKTNQYINNMNGAIKPDTGK